MSIIDAIVPSNDLEIELGELIHKYENLGLEVILDALDYYVVLLATRQDQSSEPVPWISFANHKRLTFMLGSGQ